MFFSRQLTAMIGAGITVVESLKLLKEQEPHHLLSKGIERVQKKVEEGYTLADALRFQGFLFPKIFVNLVEAGELAGKLDDILSKLAEHYEKQYSLEQKIKSASFYPKFILIVLISVVLFMVTTVLPNFVGIYDSVGVLLPLPTRALLFIGNLMASYWHFFLFIALIGYIVFNILKQLEIVRRFQENILYSLPIYGILLAKTELLKFFRTLSILLVSGVNILTALELTEKAVGSQRFAQAVKYCRQGVSRGEELAEAMAKTNVFPKVALKMVAVGEQTGSIDIMVSRAAQYYESETSHLVDRLSSLLEPLLIIIMAAVIGFICLSVLLPMLDIYQIL